MKINVPTEVIEQKILLIRGQKVMLDSDLVELYGVPTYRLNEKVKRNLKRFPPDFMFQLNSKEFQVLRSHFAMSKRGRGGRRYLPYAFTEQGVAMLSIADLAEAFKRRRSVLNSERAIEVNILIMRTFVKLREMISTHKELANKISAYQLLQLPARFGPLPLQLSFQSVKVSSRRSCTYLQGRRSSRPVLNGFEGSFLRRHGTEPRC
jgi:hypothetical protein